MKRCALFVGLIAGCGIGWMAVPASVSARSAGGGLAAAAGVHGGMRRGAAAFLQGRGLAFARGFAAKRAFRPVDLRRRQISILPYWAASGDFEPFYYYPPSDSAVTGSVAATSEPVAPSQAPATRVLVVKPGCRTEEQTVQAEAGGARLIRITRCY